MSFTNQIRLYKWLCFDLAASLIPSLIPSHLALILALILILAGHTFRTTTQVTWIGLGGTLSTNDRSGNGLAQTHCRMTLYGWRGSGNGLAETHSVNNVIRLTSIGQRIGWDALWATTSGWRRSGNSLAETYSTKDTIRLMSIGQQFGRDALCEWHHTADVDQAMVWPRCTLQVMACGWRGFRQRFGSGITLRRTLCGRYGSGNGLAEAYSGRTLCGRHRSGNGFTRRTLRTTPSGWRGSGNRLAETHSEATLCGWRGSGNGLARDSLCEGHHAADVDRATVWLRRTLIPSFLRTWVHYLLHRPHFLPHSRSSRQSLLTWIYFYKRSLRSEYHPQF